MSQSKDSLSSKLDDRNENLSSKDKFYAKEKYEPQVNYQSRLGDINQLQLQDLHLKKNLEQFLTLGQEEMLKVLSGGKTNKDLQKGAEISFSFGGNDTLEHGIGLMNILPPTIRTVTLMKSDGTRLEGTRKGYSGSFYTNSGQYLAIVSYDKIIVQNVTTSAEISQLTTAHEEKLTTYQNLKTEQPNIPAQEKELILKTCANTDVDPYLLLAIRKANNGHYGHEDQQGFHAEVELAVKYTQNAQIRYEAETNSKAFSGNNYTPEFIAYLSSRYNLFNEESYATLTTLRPILLNYKELKKLGAEFDPDKVKIQKVAPPIMTANPSLEVSTGLSRKRPGPLGDSFKQDPKSTTNFDRPTLPQFETDKANAEGQRVLRVLAPYKQLIETYSAKNGIPEALTRAIIMTESDGLPNRRSGSGAMGLMQLMPDTARTFHVTNPFDPEQSIRAGTALLGTLMRRYHGRIDLVILAYNGGAGTVDRYLFGRILKPKELTPSVLENRYLNLHAIKQQKIHRAQKTENPDYGFKVRKVMANLGYDINAIRYE